MILNIRRGRPTATHGMAAIALAVVSSCGGGDPPAASRTSLLATTSIWADITSRVACGEPVASIIPAGADPHGFEPSLRDRQAMAGAAVVVSNGQALEESLLDVLATVAAEGTNVVEVATFVDILVGDTDESHTDESHTDESHTDESHTDESHTDESHTDESHTEESHTDESHTDESHADESHAGDDGHGHGLGGDPHIWHDPRRVAGALDVIASAVIASGLPEADVEACTDAYRAELIELDTEIEALLGSVPPDRRVLVTNHDSFAYFADRYGFEVVGAVIPSTSTLGETSSGELAALTEVIEARRVPAIFTERSVAAGDAQALGDRLGIDVVTLDSDTLTAEGPASTYTGLLLANATAIAGALG